MLRKIADAPAACDLIISDYAMPLMSGCEMLKQARGLLPEIPAILISGYADDQALADAPAGVAVLRKPFTLGQMDAAISALTAGD
jgi:CheY-like chemotaxis protein